MTEKYKRIAIGFPPEEFEKVEARAKADGVTFSAKALELIRCGLFDYEESEKHEPHKK